MDDSQEKRCRCKLCGAIFKNSDMSEEHYPARSTGNDDIVALDIVKMFESLQSPKVYSKIKKGQLRVKSLKILLGISWTHS